MLFLIIIAFYSYFYICIYIYYIYLCLYLEYLYPVRISVYKAHIGIFPSRLHLKCLCTFLGEYSDISSKSDYVWNCWRYCRHSGNLLHHTITEHAWVQGCQIVNKLAFSSFICQGQRQRWNQRANCAETPRPRPRVGIPHVYHF